MNNEGIIRTVAGGVIAIKILDMGMKTVKMDKKSTKKTKLKYPEIKKKNLY